MERCQDSVSRLMESLQLTALGQQLESAFQGGDSQMRLSGQDTGAAGLQVKDRSARPTATICCLGKSLEELAGPSIFPFVKGKIRLLQNRRNILGKRLADVTAECAAHLTSLHIPG